MQTRRWRPNIPSDFGGQTPGSLFFPGPGGRPVLQVSQTDDGAPAPAGEERIYNVAVNARSSDARPGRSSPACRLRGGAVGVKGRQGGRRNARALDAIQIPSFFTLSPSHQFLAVCMEY